MKYFCLFSLIIFLVSRAYSKSPPVILEKGKSFYEMGQYLDILEDPEGSLTVKDLGRPEWSKKFKRNFEKVPNFGFSESVHWARFYLENLSSPHKDWLVSFNYYNQDRVTFYRKTLKGWDEIKTGDLFPVSSREIKERAFLFKVNPDISGPYYLKIKGVDNQMDLTLGTTQEISTRESMENYFLGLFFGVSIAMAALNLLIFFTTKSLPHLNYVLYVLTLALFMGNDFGYVLRYLTPEDPWFSNNGQALFAGLFQLFLNLFAITFLKLKEENPKLYWSHQFFVITSTILIISSFFLPFSFNVIFLSLNPLLFIFLIFFAGVYRTKMGYRPARYFVAAFAFSLLGGMILILVVAGVLPSTMIFRKALLIGHGIDLILLPMGLADRFNLMQERAFELEEKTKRLHENYSRNLEKRVAEKTLELEVEKMSIEQMMDHTYEQKKSRDQLLGNLDQGYLTFNKEGVIHEGATKITQDLLETNLFESELREIKIWDILFNNAEEKTNFKSWIKNVWEGRLAFKDLKSIAPKFFKGLKGRFIEIDFRPIYREDESNKIDKVIMIASDNTEKKRLKDLLEEDKERVEFVEICLQNPLDFVDLIDDSFSLLDDYEKIKGDRRELFRKFHTLKARYGQFGLKSVTYFINKVESAISDGEENQLEESVAKLEKELKEFIKKNRLIVEAANKFLVDEGHAIHISTLMDTKGDFRDLEEMYAHIKEHYLLSDIKEKFLKYKFLVDKAAEKQGKSVLLEVEGDEIRVDTNKYTNFVNSSIHLFLNMVDHGIESEDERIEKTKSKKGNIKATFKRNEKVFSIYIEDDGQGIDPGQIKERVLKKGLKTKEEIEGVSDNSLINLIFLPGFSTKDDLTDLSGRGVGLDAIKNEVEALDGNITVTSTLDEGTRFRIDLPILI